MEIRKLLQRIAIITAILAILGYSLFAFKGIVLGPRIILDTSLNGFATTTPLITISGRASRVKNLFLNGATTTLDLAGDFSEQLLLSRGYNIMTLEGNGKYGRSTRETIEMTLLVEDGILNMEYRIGTDAGTSTIATTSTLTL